jgi:hypothetical protein
MNNIQRGPFKAGGTYNSTKAHVLGGANRAILTKAPAPVLRAANYARIYSRSYYKQTRMYVIYVIEFFTCHNYRDHQEHVEIVEGNI